MTQPDAVQRKLRLFFDKQPRFWFEDGANLVRIGDKPSGIYYLEEGLVSLQAVSINGQEMTFNIFKPGSFFPLMWAFTQRSDNLGLVAIQRSSVRLAPVEETLHFLEHHPEVLMDVARRVFSGVEGLLHQFQLTMSSSARDRVAHVLKILALRFGHKVAGGWSIETEFTHAQLASLAGVSRETATRQIGVLKKKKLVSLQDKKIIVSDELMESI